MKTNGPWKGELSYSLVVSAICKYMVNASCQINLPLDVLYMKKDLFFNVRETEQTTWLKCWLKQELNQLNYT